MTRELCDHDSPTSVTNTTIEHPRRSRRVSISIIGRSMVVRMSVLTLALTAVSVGQSTAAAQGRQVVSDRGERLDRLAAAMDLKDGRLVRLSIDGTVGARVRTTVAIDGVDRTLELLPHSVRSDGFELKAQVEGGSYVTLEPPPVRTLRGTVVGIEGSVVAASLLEEGLYARIMMPNDTQYWIEPVQARLADAAVDEYVIYRGVDVIPSNGQCLAIEHNEQQAKGSASGVVLSGGQSFIAEVAVDADFEFFQRWGSGTTARMESVINSMNIQYIRDVGIEHQIVTTIIRTVSGAPYDSTNPNTLLNQVRTQWRNNHTTIARDTVEMFTGKNIDGSVIGIAWVGVVCSTNFGYSVVQSDCCGSFGCATDLSAHEIGHNWNASHCSCSGFTMNSGLQCANRFQPSATIPSILNHRNTRTCLDVGPGFTCPTSNPILSEAVVVSKNRYLSIRPNNPGELTAIRVVAVDLPVPFDVLNGQSMWLAESALISENPGTIDPAGAPGFPTLRSAGLACEPFFADWGALGTINVASSWIVPGATYQVDEVNAVCSVSDPTSFSIPLGVGTSVFGDVVENCATSPCPPPDGIVGFATDVVAILTKFVSDPGAPSKARVDLVPAIPDGLVGITDVLFAQDAFLGFGYPFAPVSSTLCP